MSKEDFIARFSQNEDSDGNRTLPGAIEMHSEYNFGAGKQRNNESSMFFAEQILGLKHSKSFSITDNDQNRVIMDRQRGSGERQWFEISGISQKSQISDTEDNHGFDYLNATHYHRKCKGRQGANSKGWTKQKRGKNLPKRDKILGHDSGKNRIKNGYPEVFDSDNGWDMERRKFRSVSRDRQHRKKSKKVFIGGPRNPFDFEEFEGYVDPEDDQRYRKKPTASSLRAGGDPEGSENSSSENSESGFEYLNSAKKKQNELRSDSGHQNKTQNHRKWPKRDKKSQKSKKTEEIGFEWIPGRITPKEPDNKNQDASRESKEGFDRSQNTLELNNVSETSKSIFSMFYWNPNSINSSNQQRSALKKQLIQGTHLYESNHYKKYLKIESLTKPEINLLGPVYDIICLTEPFREYKNTSYYSIRPEIDPKIQNKLFVQLLLKRSKFSSYTTIHSSRDIIHAEATFRHPKTPQKAKIHIFVVYFSHSEKDGESRRDRVISYLAANAVPLATKKRPCFVVGDFNTNIRLLFLERYWSKFISQEELGRLRSIVDVFRIEEMETISKLTRRRKMADGSRQRSKIDFLLTQKLALDDEGIRYDPKSNSVSDHYCFRAFFKLPE